MKGQQQVSENMGSHLLDSTISRRRFLRAAGFVGLGAVLGPTILGGVAGCACTPAAKIDVRMGIMLGNQILWRYLAQKKDDLLGRLGYNVTFVNYDDDGRMVGDFLAGKIDVCATILNALPDISTISEAQVFLPIAWLKSGFPIVASEASSSIRSVADLQGKRLGWFGPNHASSIYWQAFVQENYGFDLKGRAAMVEYQGVNPDEMLKEGRVDAAIVESHALSMLLTKGTYRQIGDIRTEWSKISKSDRLLTYGGYVAKSGWIRDHKKFVDDLIRVNYDALKAYKSNQASVVDPAVTYAGENAVPMTKDSGSYVADYLGYDDVSPDRVYLTSADIDDYKKMFSLLAKTGVLKSIPQDVDKLFYLSDTRPK